MDMTSIDDHIGEFKKHCDNCYMNYMGKALSRLEYNILGLVFK